MTETKAARVPWSQHARQVGSYGWAKEAALDAAEVETRLMALAVLVNKPLDVIRDQVETLAKAGKAGRLAIIDQLEYSHHYSQVQRLELPPARTEDRRTVTVQGKAYHWAAGLGGKLELKPGPSPW